MKGIRTKAKTVPIGTLGKLLVRDQDTRTAFEVGIITATISRPIAKAIGARYRKAYSEALKLFGNEKDARGWLREPSKALGNVSPESLLSTKKGLALVLYELAQMEHGHPV